MLIEFFSNSNNANIKSLLETSTILEGNETLTLEIIKNNPHKYKVLSGVFRFEENIKDEVLKEIIFLFKKTFFSGMNKNQYNCLFLKQNQKSVYFFIPKIELVTLKYFPVYWYKSDRKLKHTFQDFINLKYNLSNPLDLEKLRTLQTKRTKYFTSLKEEIHNIIETEVQKGFLLNRDDVISFLENAQISILKKGKDYIIIHLKDENKTLKLKGLYYEKNFDIRKLTTNLNDSTTKNRGASQEKLGELERLLEKLIQKRAKFHIEKFKRKKQHPISRGFGEFGKYQKTNFKFNNNLFNSRYNFRSFNRLIYKFKCIKFIFKQQRLDSARAFKSKKQRWILYSQQKRSLESWQWENRSKQQNYPIKRIINDTFRDEAFRTIERERKARGEVEQKVNELSKRSIQRARSIKERSGKISNSYSQFAKRFKGVLQLYRKRLNQSLYEVAKYINLISYLQDFGFKKVENLSTKITTILKNDNDVFIMVNFVENKMFFYDLKNKKNGTIVEYIQDKVNLKFSELKELLTNLKTNYNNLENLPQKITKELYKIQTIFYANLEENNTSFLQDYSVKIYKKKYVFPLYLSSGIVGLAYYKNEVTFQKGSKLGIWFDIPKNGSKILAISDDLIDLFEVAKEKKALLYIPKPLKKEQLNIIEKIIRKNQFEKVLFLSKNIKKYEKFLKDIL